MFKPGDAVLLLIILAIAVFWSRNSNDVSEEEAVSLRIVSAADVDTVSLSADTLITMEHLTVEIRNRRAAFISSDCPTQQCVRAGFIGTPGQMSACMPNGIWIEILGTKKLTDAVSY